MFLKKIKQLLEAFLVTGFFTGLLPKAPGTFASFLSMFLIYIIILKTGYMGLIFFSFLFYYIGIHLIKKYEEQHKIHDDPRTAIDEVIGMFFGALFIYPLLDKNLLLEELFIYTLLFRFFDILKPGIINYIDKNIRNEIGTILDDIVAAFYAAVMFLIYIYIYKKIELL